MGVDIYYHECVLDFCKCFNNAFVWEPCNHKAQYVVNNTTIRNAVNLFFFNSRYFLNNVLITF